MKRPSHATVVAYVALFVALAGSAYAGTQLPKNSVGPKQLKKNAVTTAKIKAGAVTEPKIANAAVTGPKIADNAVTGAKVDESSLGQVPSAATAGSATAAATATDAAALNGIPSDGFLQTSDVLYGSASVETPSIQTLFTAPGMFSLTTVGDGEKKFKVRFENISSATWFFSADTAILSLGPGKSGMLDLGGPPFQATVVGIDAADEANHAVIDCGFRTTAPSRAFCSARVPPAS
jgi:hypothetical protein